MTTGLRTWFDKAGPLAQSLTVLAAVIALLTLAMLIWRGTRALRGKKAADTLTVVAAAMASSVAATGMWHFFSRTMHLPTWIQAVLFAFMEISVLASALRARANVARDGQAGADGLAVWVLTCASGLMSASEAGSVQEALVRLGAPLVAAWLWERSMVPERRAQKVKQGTAEAAVRWLFSVKRIAVRLGLATALGADLETEDANRRIDRFVRADNRSQRAGWLTRRHAGRRRDRAHARLMEQARMQADPRALYAHLGRQAILDVLARLGGDDAVIDRERARQMQHILTDATTDKTTSKATASATTSPASAAAPPPAEAPQPAQNPHTPLAPPAPAPTAEPQLIPRQDELPLQLPAQPMHTVDATNGAPTAFHIPAARQPTTANGTDATNGNNRQPANGVPPTNGNNAAHGANRNGAAARAQIPVEPVRFVAAPLPEPEPERTYAYSYTPEPAYEPEPEPALPIPPAAVPAPVIDHQLAARITKALADARTTPNLLKLANELGISPALMHDTIEAMGGYNALVNRLRQDKDAENTDPDLTFYPA